MMKVQVFSGHDANKLTGEVNDWLASKPSIKIFNQQVAATGAGGHYSTFGDCFIIVWYEQ
jgi:hypothetical protein